MENIMKKVWPILVVDDEEVMCESMAAWLREDGYRVDTAPDGQRALELAKSTDYAICFIDLKMPGGMDGIETMMEIHRIRPEASDHHHHRLRHRGYGHPGHERGRAGVHRKALPSAGNLHAGFPHSQTQEAAK